MDREPLAADGGGTGEQDGLIGALGFDEHVIHGLVVQVGVVVVHQLRIGTVIVLHAFGGDTLAEVGLEAVTPMATSFFR